MLTHSITGYQKIEFIVSIFSIISPLILLPFSPFVAFYFSLISLCIVKDNPLIRNILGVVAIISGSLIAASRVTGMSLSDDFSTHYYTAYGLAVDGGGLFYYHAEFLISLYFKLLAALFGSLPPDKVMFFVALLCSGLFFLWLSKFVLPQINGSGKNFCLALCLAFFIYFQATQLMRQMISSSIILFVISYIINGDNKKAFLFTLLATFAHLTAIPIVFLLLIIIRWGAKGGVLLSLPAAFFAYLLKNYVAIILVFLSSIPVLSSLFGKLEYYSDQSTYTFLNAIYGSKSAILIGLISLIPVKFWSYKNFEKWRDIFLFGTILYFVFSIVPNGGRVMMVIPNFLLGFLIFIAFSKYPFVKYSFVLYLFVAIFFPYGLVGKDPDFALWNSYNWYGTDPFYYL